MLMYTHNRLNDFGFENDIHLTSALNLTFIVYLSVCKNSATLKLPKIFRLVTVDNTTNIKMSGI